MSVSSVVTEPAAALGESDAMLLQELSREILKTGRLSQNGTNVFAQDSFLGFIFGLPDGQAGSCVPGVGVSRGGAGRVAAPNIPVR